MSVCKSLVLWDGTRDSGPLHIHVTATTSHSEAEIFAQSRQAHALRRRTLAPGCPVHDKHVRQFDVGIASPQDGTQICEFDANGWLL